MATQNESRVRDLLQQHVLLSIPVADLASDASLYDAGMTSRASVSIMLALENEFDVEFPDSMLRREVFESVAAIAGAIAALQGGGRP